MTKPDNATPAQWINTEQLIERLPAPRATLTGLARMDFGTGKELPVEIPLPQAVALAAVAQAHARGVPKTKRIYELVRAHPSKIGDHLVVVPRTGPAQLVALEGSKPVPAIVIDLPELIELIVRADPISG